MSWTTDRTSDFAAYIAEFPGGMISVSGFTDSPCIHTPIEKTKPMGVGTAIGQPPFVLTRSSRFDMLATDFASMGLGDKKQFSCAGILWCINRINDDTSADSIIQFWAERVI